MDHPRNRGYDAVHLRKNADRQVGVYSYWISGFGGAHCMGGFKDLISVLFDISLTTYFLRFFLKKIFNSISLFLGRPNLS